jgi:hypothetical protein
VVDLPPTTDFGERFTEAIEAAFTVRVPVLLFVPSLAVIVTSVGVPTGVVEMVNGDDTVDPPATVTEAGTAATAGLELVSAIVALTAGAADVSVTVLAVVELPPTIEDGESVNDDSATLVSEKLAERPKTPAVTMKGPAVALADALIEAVPFGPVTALPADSVAVAPETGAAKVTAIPLRGAPQGSLSVTVKGTAKAVWTTADCGEPAETARVDPVVLRLTSFTANDPGEDPKLERVNNSTIEIPPALSNTPINGAELSPALLSVPDTP